MSDLAPGSPGLDTSLLAGFRFACRPDCGLCCYTEPRVSRAERERLVQIEPAVSFTGEGADRFIASRGDGGACGLLKGNRCGAHVARPHPCREFPLTAHVGTRLQATVVLSCPGVDLSALEQLLPRDGGPPGAGFPSELTALESRIDSSTPARLAASTRRRRKVERALTEQGRWQDEEEVRRVLERSLSSPSDRAFPVADPPAAEDGLDLLPLFFDDREAPVAMARGLGGWEFLELRPVGGVGRSLGVVPPPDRAPPVRPDGARMLDAYLRYWLRRDALFGFVHAEMVRGRGTTTVLEAVRAELETIGAVVLSRAEARVKLQRGVAGPLSRDDIVDGIRASDQDLLDRDGWGDRF